MLKPIFKSPTDAHYFFGYYDKSELNKSSTKLLAMRVKFIGRMPKKEDYAVIGYFDLEKKGQPFVEVASTRAFNWQQGSMLQWLGPDHETTIIYNDREEDRFISIILNLDSKKSKRLPLPIYTVAPDGKTALCIDFERHYFCHPGYSYEGIIKKKKNKDIVPDDGIWRLDLVSGDTKKILNVNDLISNKYLSNMENGVHYVEHLMLNPSGSRFCFLHRWKLAEGGIYDRIYTLDIDGKNLFLLNDSGRVGHFCWRYDDEILLYGALANPINSLRRYKNIVKFLFKPLLPTYHRLVNDNSLLSKKLTGDSYILLKDRSNDKTRVAPEISTEDGHPSFPSGNQSVFITDTYPNLKSVAKLSKYNLITKENEILAELCSIKEFDNTGMRCDLHPKCSYDGNFVSIDTMDQEVRGIYLYKLNG